MGQLSDIEDISVLLSEGDTINVLNQTGGDLSDYFAADGNKSSTDGDTFREVLLWLNVYFTPAIILVGFIGNILSLLVFCFSHLRRQSSSLYLASLALSDLGFLAALFIVWLERVGIHIFTRNGWCQSVTYVTKICGFLAVWNVVSFTSERYIIVYNPLRKDRMCTKRNARIVVLVLCVFAALIYVYIFWTYDVIRIGSKSACTPVVEHYDVITIMSSIDTLLACVIPSVVIIVLNIRIIHKIHHYQKHRNDIPTQLPTGDQNFHRQIIHASISTAGSMHIKFATNRTPEAESGTSKSRTWNYREVTKETRVSPPRGRNQFRIARMLLVLSSVFVLVNLPYHVCQVISFLHHLVGGSAKQSRTRGKWQELFHIVYFVNFAINFFIYSACGRQFRMAFRRLMNRWRYRLEKWGQVVVHYGRNRPSNQKTYGISHHLRYKQEYNARELLQNR